jgi:hypothetical protein
MNPDQKREKLADLRYGPYITPIVAIDVIVECEVRGLVRVVGQSPGPIQWPIGEQNGQRQLIVFKALARAVRQESPHAVAAAWGIDIATVETWRSACHQPPRRKKQTISSPPIPWKRTDDELISRLSLAEAARLTGRTLTAVRKRRRALGLPDGRTAAQRAIRMENTIEDRAAVICRVLRVRTIELTASLAALQATFQRARASLAYWRAQPRPRLSRLNQSVSADNSENAP